MRKKIFSKILSSSGREGARSVKGCAKVFFLRSWERCGVRSFDGSFWLFGRVFV